MAKHCSESKGLSLALALVTPPNRVDETGWPTYHCLKRRGKTFQESEVDKDYAVYMGKHNGKYTVVIKDMPMVFSNRIEQYDSLAEILADWEVD